MNCLPSSRLVALALALGASSLVSASAALVYSQDFESLSASGNGTSLDGQGGYSTNSTTSVRVYDGGGVTAAYTQGENIYGYAGGNNAVKLTQPTGATNANAGWVSLAPQSGQDLYFSFTFNYVNANQGSDTGADFFRLQFSNNTSLSSLNYLGVQLQGGTGGGNNLLATRARTDSNNPGIVTATAGTLISGTSYLVSGRLSWNGTAYNAITMWGNPLTTLTAPSQAGEYAFTQTSSATGNTLTSINSLVFQNGFTPDNLDNGDSMAIDNLRVGTAWQDVAPTVQAVPEPGTVALLAAGAMVGLWSLRRRRNQLS